MTLTKLENLVRIGKLNREPPADEEIEGLLQSAEDRLSDAKRAANMDDGYGVRADVRALRAAGLTNMIRATLFAATGDR